MMHWTLAVFAYNEEGNLIQTVASCREFLSKGNRTGEVIVVDDGSTDRTPALCAELSRLHPEVSCIHHPRNLGIGAALLTGYRAAKGDYVCAVPADGQFDPSELEQVPAFGPLVFYSFCRVRTGYPPWRRLLTVLNRLFNRWFAGIRLHDVNWVKVYRRDQLLLAAPTLTSSLVESELCSRLLASGCKAIELPSAYRERKSGVAKGGHWKTVVQVLAETPGFYLSRFLKNRL